MGSCVEAESGPSPHLSNVAAGVCDTAVLCDAGTEPKRMFGIM